MESELDFAEDPATQILVPATPPAMPLVLADDTFLKSLAFFEARASTLTIASGESATRAAKMLKEITKAGRDFDAARLELKRPFMDIERQIDATAKPVNARINAAMATVKKRLAEWAEVEAARVRKEALARQQELDRLEKLRLEEEAEAAKRAAEIIAASPQLDTDIEFDEDPEPEPLPKTETEKRIDAVRFAPAVSEEKPSGIAYVHRLISTIVDANKLPEQYVIRTPNERMIREVYCTGWKEGMPIPEVPGVAFKVDKTVRSTGKGQS